MSKISTQKTVANEKVILPLQYSVLIEELDTLFNKTIQNDPRQTNIDKGDIIKLVHTLYEIDRADYNKGIVRGTSSYAGEYQIPVFLKFMVLPNEMTIDGFPLGQDIIKRYDRSKGKTLSVVEWDGIIRRVRFLAKRAKLSIDVDTLSAIDSLRPSLDGLSKAFVNAISHGCIRDINQDSLFEVIDAINIDGIDDTAFIKVRQYVKGKLN